MAYARTVVTLTYRRISSSYLPPAQAACQFQLLDLWPRVGANIAIPAKLRVTFSFSATLDFVRLLRTSADFQISSSSSSISRAISGIHLPVVGETGERSPFVSRKQREDKHAMYA